ncbi:unnamed protein product [Dovyalis caffra]|uniref:Uncharacterized protein n=1 Tax=Dovyalis caffra TaxID=77055 RepID=A0AAV1RPC5_9ROSI|nr:unnamed protein product [Dovyalis caffra]
MAPSEVKTESSEEKMDMLWENFNEEELLRVSSNSLGRKKQYSDDSLDSESGRGMNQLCCAKKDLKMPKSEKNSLISAPARHKRQYCCDVQAFAEDFLASKLISRSNKES